MRGRGKNSLQNKRQASLRENLNHQSLQLHGRAFWLNNAIKELSDKNRIYLGLAEYQGNKLTMLQGDALTAPLARLQSHLTDDFRSWLGYRSLAELTFLQLRETDSLPAIISQHLECPELFQYSIVNKFIGHPSDEQRQFYEIGELAKELSPFAIGRGMIGDVLPPQGCLLINDKWKLREVNYKIARPRFKEWIVAQGDFPPSITLNYDMPAGDSKASYYLTATQSWQDSDGKIYQVNIRTLLAHSNAGTLVGRKRILGPVIKRMGLEDIIDDLDFAKPKRLRGDIAPVRHSNETVVKNISKKPPNWYKQSEHCKHMLQTRVWIDGRFVGVCSSCGKVRVTNHNATQSAKNHIISSRKTLRQNATAFDLEQSDYIGDHWNVFWKNIPPVDE